MTLQSIDPLAPVPVDPLVAALPKADLHLHAGSAARVDKLMAAREGRSPHDWRAETRRLLDEVPPGIARLNRLNGGLDTERYHELEDQPEHFVARVADILEGAAADGAVLVEIRFGGGGALWLTHMPLFREAERRVRVRCPRLQAAAIAVVRPGSDPGRLERSLTDCLLAAAEGLGGVDILPEPYDREADWAAVYRWAERAAAAGLGITAHAAEFSLEHLRAALRVPGIRRLGHAVHAAYDPELLEAVAHSGVTVECCLTSNVLLGAVPSFAEHPIRRFIEHGIPVTLNSDTPLRLATGIGREYAIAAALGFTPAELLGFTRNAVRAAFVSEARRTALLAELDAWEREHPLLAPARSSGG